ncbi:MAG TPA: hypothetical protein VL475_01730 [Planctomycetaceae bacterium]|jgi:hypothetical protein|nr:hypothetical protein [Planctomycetaceae bacterium]
MSTSDDDDFELGDGPEKPFCIVCGEPCGTTCPVCEAGLCQKLGCRELHAQDCAKAHPNPQVPRSESEF